MRKLLLIFITIFTSIGLALAQSSDCPVEFASAFDQASQLCIGTGRNQVCYGNNLVNMVPQRANLQYRFTMPGDITDVNNVQALSLSALDESSGNWGIALMRLLANLDPSNSQDVTILLFGDVNIDNAVPYQDNQEVESNGYANIRRYPKADAVVVESIAPGDVVQITGKLADESWVHVINPKTNYTGWVASFLLNNVDFDRLDVVDPYSPYFGPMQAFYFNSGTASYDCASVPGDGMLIQTPEGLRRVTLWINEVTIEFLPGSGTTTLLKTENDNSVSINMLEGSAYVQSGQSGYVVVPGSKVTVHNNPTDNSMLIDAPQPYDSTVSNAPVDILDRPIQSAPPADVVTIDSSNNVDATVTDTSTNPTDTTSSTTGTSSQGNGNPNANANGGKPVCPGNSCSAPGQNNGNGNGNGNGNDKVKKNDCPGNSCYAPGHNKNS